MAVEDIQQGFWYKGSAYMFLFLNLLDVKTLLGHMSEEGLLK